MAYSYYPSSPPSYMSTSYDGPRYTTKYPSPTYSTSSVDKAHRRKSSYPPAQYYTSLYTSNYTPRYTYDTIRQLQAQDAHPVDQALRDRVAKVQHHITSLLATHHQPHIVHMQTMTLLRNTQRAIAAFSIDTKPNEREAQLS